MEYSGAAGKLIHEKKPEAKNLCDTVPLSYQLLYYQIIRDFPINCVHIYERGLCS